MEIQGLQSSSSSASMALAKTSPTLSFDPRDTNQDGVVSAAEALAYALAHPELQDPSSDLNTYTQTGASVAQKGGSTSTFSFTA